MTEIEKLPPQDIEAEEAVLGAMMIDPGAIVRVSTIIDGADYFREKHRWLHGTIMELHEDGSGIDLITISDKLEANNLLKQAGGNSWVTSMVNAVPTSMHAEHYAKIVAEKATRRRLFDAASFIAGRAHREDVDIKTVLADCQAAVLAVHGKDVRGRLFKHGLSEYYDNYEGMANEEIPTGGLPTGFVDLDRIIKGIRGYTIVAGRPSMGKSSLALDIVVHNVLKGARIAWFGLEEKEQAIINRIVAKAVKGSEDVSDLRDGKVRNVPSFMRKISELADGGPGDCLWIDDTQGISTMEIRMKVMKIIAIMGGIDMIVVDYLQLANDAIGSTDRLSRTSNVSEDLKNLSQELGIPVIAVSQLSRACDSRNNKRPILSDLRESGTLEQDADVVIFVYRDEMYDENTERRNLADINVAKHRDGPVGTTDLFFVKRQARFQDVELRVKEVYY